MTPGSVPSHKTDLPEATKRDQGFRSKFLPKRGMIDPLSEARSIWQKWRWTLTALVLVAAAYGILLAAVGRRTGTDDFTFAENIAPFPTVYDWVSFRYETWSGRIFPETWLYLFTAAPIIWWQLATWILTLVCIGLLVAYGRLIWSTASDAITAFIVCASGALLLLVDVRSFGGGFTWVTGSMNYFWLVPFALGALYPVCHMYGRKGGSRGWWWAASIPAAFVASVSAEQLGATLVTLSAVIFLERAVVLRRLSLLPLLTFLASAVGFAVVMLAPGNANRSVVDARIWLPEFFDTPLSQRLPSAVRFVVDGLVNETGAALPLMWTAILVASFSLRGARRGLVYAAQAVSVIGLTTVGLRGVSAGRPLFNLHAGWLENPTGVVAGGSLVFWILLLLATAVAPLLLFPDRFGAGVFLLLAAGAAALAAITFSASMYASGPRVAYLPGTIVLLAGFLLMVRGMRDIGRHAWIAPAVFGGIAVFHYIYVVASLTRR